MIRFIEISEIPESGYKINKQTNVNSKRRIIAVYSLLKTRWQYQLFDIKSIYLIRKFADCKLNKTKYLGQKILADLCLSATSDN